MKKLLFSIILFSVGLICKAQHVSIGTNLVDYANFGTINLNGSIAVARHWTIDAEWSYNPWTFHKNKPEQFQVRSLTGALGTRYWPWHVFAGWWLNTQIQYQIYNRGGVLKARSEEGRAAGMGFSFGYTFLINQHLNLELGAGFWGGTKKYTVYRCTNCGRIEEQGEGWFIMPNDIMITLSYIF